MEWIIYNMGTLITALILLIIVSAIVLKLLKDKKQGKSSCGCGCANCAMSGSCHKSG